MHGRPSSSSYSTWLASSSSASGAPERPFVEAAERLADGRQASAAGHDPLGAGLLGALSDVPLARPTQMPRCQPVEAFFPGTLAAVRLEPKVDPSQRSGWPFWAVSRH